MPRRTPDPPPIVTPGSRLREAREEAGLTQSEAAAAARVSQPYWAQVERGVKSPGLEQLWQLAIAIGADPHRIDPRLAPADP
jgi:transcriptional regulator with XRE-family HTH domain